MDLDQKQKEDIEAESYEDSPPRRASNWNVERKASAAYDDPFAGDEEVGQGTVQYRTLEWWQAAMIMIAETISLGILSLPSVLSTVGLVPGIILIVGMGLLATYTGYVLGQFKMAYPQIHSFADAGFVLFEPLGVGAIAREFFGGAQVIFLMFTMGSHILTWTIMLNTVTGSATCTIVWAVIGLLIFWVLDLPRTLKGVSWLSIVAFISIVSAVFIVMIDLGVDPKNSPRVIHAFQKPKFYEAFNSVANIVFAYAGHVAFFGFISEFRDQTEWPKALFLLQGSDTVLYIIVAIVVYIYAGDQVESPALGSAGPVVKKIAWGIAIPTILVAGVIYGHVASKYIFVRLFRGTRHLTARSWLSFGSWAGIAAILWLIAFIIAESIPVFNDLLSLVSALFASWFTYGMSGVFWIFMNWGQLTKSPTKIFLTVLNATIFCMGAAICGIGLYSSGTAISVDSKSMGGNSWTCKSNAQ